MLEVVYVVPSTFIFTVDRFTPEPPASSTTLKVIGCLLFVTYAPFDGDTSVIAGFIVSFTISLNDSPRVASVASFVTTVPASLVISILIG